MDTLKSQVLSLLKQGIDPEKVATLVKADPAIVRAISNEASITVPTDFTEADKRTARARIATLASQGENLPVALKASVYINEAGRSAGLSMNNVNLLIQAALAAGAKHQNNELLIDVEAEVVEGRA